MAQHDYNEQFKRTLNGGAFEPPKPTETAKSIQDRATAHNDAKKTR